MPARRATPGLTESGLHLESGGEKKSVGGGGESGRVLGRTSWEERKDRSFEKGGTTENRFLRLGPLLLARGGGEGQKRQEQRCWEKRKKNAETL